METFAIYLLKSVIWLTGFALVYFLFLRNERFFLLKRYYLVSGILISFLFPLFSIHYQVVLPSPDVTPADFIPAGNTTINTGLQASPDKPFDYKLILLVLYLTGILFFAFRLIWHIRSLYKTINKANINNRHQVKLIRASEFPTSFSFFNYVFINPSVSETEVKEIINHELVHVHQKHWFDLLLVELLCLLQWLNPFVWIYTRFIRLNHEYLADEVALQRTSNPAIYKAALVNQLFSSPVFSLSNSFNYSLNKKRFDMMKKIITSPYRKMKMLFVLPVFAIVFYAFATPEYNYTAPSDNAITIDQASPIVAKVVKGGVLQEDGSPLPGVTIVVSGTPGWGILTDVGGKFAISGITEDANLVFSCKGYKTQILKPDFSSEMSVKMLKDPDYQEQIKIRSSDGSLVKPLIIVDGVVSEKGIEGIDPALISSMDVLKDKSATDKYGEKGKDGVIEITTKRKASETQITTSQAQTNQKTVKGVVLKEDGQPLEGVDVTSTGTMGNAFFVTTGKDGRFELNNSQADAILLFSSRGYKRVTLKADFNKEMSVRMEKDPEYKAPSVQRPNPLVVIDGVISEKNFSDARKDLGYDLGPVKSLFGKEATDKYGEKGANGVMEITTRKKALEMGLKSPFPRLAPEDFPTFQNQRFNSFNDWVAGQVKYPSEAQTKKIEGWITVNFMVELNGTISNVVPAGLIDPILSEEVIRAIKTSPRWEAPKNPAVDAPFTSSVTLGFKLPDQIKEAPFVVVEQMPMYPGGDVELLNFIKVNTKYPEAAKAEKIEGRVIIRFVVNTEGNTEGLTVLKGIHPLLDAEAVRVVSMLTGFKPGMQGGKAVNVWYMVPINFSLPQTNQP